MFSDTTALAPHRATLSRLWTWLTNSAPEHPAAPDPAADLERLALSAPHLLADIGFTRDPRASTPDRTLWRNDTLGTVTIDQTTSVSIR